MTVRARRWTARAMGIAARELTQILDGVCGGRGISCGVDGRDSGGQRQDDGAGRGVHAELTLRTVDRRLTIHPTRLILGRQLPQRILAAT
jgi:hypothetical protein